MKREFVKSGEAAEILGTTPQTLRYWEKQGKFTPGYVSPGGTRHWRLSDLTGDSEPESDSRESAALCYARVSSKPQQGDLSRQKEMLESFCAAKGWECEIIEDLGSGMKHDKKGLHEILDRILAKDFSRLVVTHKDRLSRFASDLIALLCEKQNIELVVINRSEEVSFEEELAADVLEIITVFSARMHGKRSVKHRRIMEALKN